MGARTLVVVCSWGLCLLVRAISAPLCTETVSADTVFDVRTVIRYKYLGC